MRNRFLAVVNPAAGGGRCGKLARGVLDSLRRAGVELDVAESRLPGQATSLVRDAYGQGYYRFLAVGGDGTAYEIINGLFPGAESSEPPTLGFLPLGTGNSFLRDFGADSVAQATQALLAGRGRRCDAVRLRHKDGVIHYINLLSMGFAADVAAVRDRRFKSLGPLGYLLGVFVCLVRLRPQTFPLRVEGEGEIDRRPCLFLSFNNSKFTGGKMLIAPQADPSDGLVEFVRWGAIGRLRLLGNLHRLYDGSHILHPQASRRATRRIEFQLESPVTVMVDGEVLSLQCQSLEVLPGALTVLV